MSRFATGLLNSIWYSNHRLKWLLWPLSLVFRWLVWLRRWLYRHGWLKSVQIGLPVIVIGNISVGGTGKTPCVIWLARELTRRGYRVGIVTRGYGGRNEHWPQPVRADSSAQSLGDESVLIAQQTGCSVAAGPDRVAAAQLLLDEGPKDVILSDDGLQHYRMARALEIAVVDGTRGLGNGLCLPAGPLREPPSRLDHVDAVIVNSGDWRRAGAYEATLTLAWARHLRSGAVEPMSNFRGREVHAVAGIGHPERFFDALRNCGMAVDGRPLDDHAEIAPGDLAFDDSNPVMITEKDAVKCKTLAHDRVWSVAAELALQARDERRLMRLVMRQLESEDNDS
jgi:tetraacyldisaccharide 4'-kinase